MSELKVYVKPLKTNVLGQTIVGQSYYLKSEADKVIAELEESHKKEVGQLLIEIAELKAQKAQAEDDCAYWKMNEGNAANAMHETEEYAMQLYKEAQHHKYKRCVDMAMFCHVSSVLCEGPDSLFYRRWFHKWYELAKKFKEAK
jgi:hypothetical protein